MSTRTLTREEIEKLFAKLNEKLAKANVRGELFVVGGAVMCLVFQSRPSTRDVDAFFEPTSTLRKLAAQLAQEEDLPQNWLNDSVKGYFGKNGTFDVYVEHSHLLVHTATAEYLLAMKCLSMRIGEEFEDSRDIQYLLRFLNIQTFSQAVEVITQFYPKEQFPQKTFYALEEFLKAS